MTQQQNQSSKKLTLLISIGATLLWGISVLGCIPLFVMGGIAMANDAWFGSVWLLSALIHSLVVILCIVNMWAAYTLQQHSLVVRYAVIPLVTAIIPTGIVAILDIFI